MPEPKCPRCRKPFSPGETIESDRYATVHVDCGRPRCLSPEEYVFLYVYCWDHVIAECATCAQKFRQQEFGSAPFSVSAYLCLHCQSDLTDSVDMPQINLPGAPLTLTGRVTRITDGQFTVTGPMATGTRVRMGRTAVLETGNVQVVISGGRSEPFDLGVFTHFGIDPRRKRYVLIKSRQHFRAGFEPIARHIVLCDGDGCTSSDLALFTYRNRRRPLYPFETA